MSKMASMNKMKLGDFIAQTVGEIIDGVVRAQDYAKDKGAGVNPKHVNWSSTKHGFFAYPSSGDDPAPLLTPIDFDVLLTIGDDEKAQGGIGVFAASFGIGVKAEAKEYAETVNRISFQILARLPQQ
jgi:hypothetical protein